MNTIASSAVTELKMRCATASLRPSAFEDIAPRMAVIVVPMLAPTASARAFS